MSKKPVHIRQKVLSVASILFGLMMVNSGLNKFFNYMPVPDDLPEAVVKAMTAFVELGWFYPLIATVEIIGGVLFAIPKSRPLGAVVIFPVVVSVVLFHWFQAQAGIPIVLVILGVNLWAIAENRGKYLRMIK